MHRQIRTPESAIELIKRWESHRRTWYEDPIGVDTIGYGFTKHTRGIDLEDVPVPLSKDTAETLLIGSIARHYEPGVRQALGEWFGSLHDHQIGALVSFCWNVGVGALDSSDLAEKIRNGEMAAAADELMEWVYAGDPPEILPGLVQRRKAEREMFTGHPERTKLIEPRDAPVAEVNHSRVVVDDRDLDEIIPPPRISKEHAEEIHR